MERIGRWLGGALVFENVFAQAPYTSCSVPTMFTGVGFSSHDVVRNDDRLHDDEVTLAEALSAGGYRTVGFTATPNNSRHLGMAQGFDEFTELWQGVDWETSIDPFFAADAVVSRIEAGLGKAPVFLMVHLVPPHSPYTPPAEYRVWSDPAYRGPADGSQSYLSSIRGRPEDVSEADLEELISLYDANIAFAAAAVDEILAALDDAGRLDDAILLVTADHGEAFFEHGHESHNSTVYDEMLRVPFMLRLPGGGRPDGFDAGRLASLEDLSPTVLALSGLAPPPRATGASMLGADRRDRILLRTAEQQRITGFRLGQYKVIADRWGRITELYDLASDPRERNNLFVDRPEIVSWMAAEWRRTAAAQPPRFDAEARDISEDEREMLRQLGYVH
jgi:arylsulfatase A-like enzyme